MHVATAPQHANLPPPYVQPVVSQEYPRVLQQQPTVNVTITPEQMADMMGYNRRRLALTPTVQHNDMM